MGLFFGTGNEYYERLGSIYALERATGQVKNQFVVTGQVHSTLRIVEGVMYFGCADGCVYALDQQKMVTNPAPRTMFKNTRKLDLGEIPQNLASLDTSVFVYNMGDAPDSVIMSHTGYGEVVNAFILNPTSFILAPYDSQAVEIKLNATLLTAKRYNFALSLASSYNLEQRLTLKSVTFRVVTPTSVDSRVTAAPASFALEQNYPNPFMPIQLTLGYTEGAAMETMVSKTLDSQEKMKP